MNLYQFLVDAVETEEKYKELDVLSKLFHSKLLNPLGTK